MRINAIKGTSAATIETSYTTSPLTATQIGTTDFPITALKDACLSSVARIVRAYAFIPNHPFRNKNLSQTASITHKSVIPAVDSTGKSIVGVYGAVRNASTGEVMTEQPVQIIENIVSDSGNFLKDVYNYFKIVGERLYVTETAVIDVVTWDEAAERAAIDANGSCPLPDALYDCAWAAMVALLIKDSEWEQQAILHENYVQSQLAAMSNGAISFSPVPQAPTTQASIVS